MIPKSLDQLPELKLNHLHRLTDDTGMLQHAIFTIPNRREGYTTDDNARALIFAVLLEQLEEESLQLDRSEIDLLRIRLLCYLAFLEHAFNPAKGRFRNFLRYDRRWNEAVGSEDCHGRALWALGTVLGRSRGSGIEGRCRPFVRVFSSRSGGIQQSAGLGLHPARNSGISRLRIPETATPRKCDPPSASDCSKCTSRSAARIGNGLKTFWPTETRDCPKPCCSWAPLARMIA